MGSRYLSRLRATAIRIFESASHVSAPFIAVFLLVHLSAPASAIFGGSSVASRTMLLGREYYQSGYTESLLVLTPLALHAMSSFLKRLVSPRGMPRPANHALAITGYATMLIFLPIHFLVHREYPTIETPPIFSVGPAELDYEFVKTGLQVWPGRSWLLYGGLLLSTTLHMADGLQILWATWLKDVCCWSLSNRTRRRVTMLGAFAVPSLLGVYVVYREPLLAFPSLVTRYQGVYLSSYIFQG